VALRLAQEGRAEYSTLSRRLRERIVEGVLAAVPAGTLNGHPQERLPNNAHFSFEGAGSDDMLAALDKQGIAASAGSACTSATWEPSHVLAAMGVPLARAVAALRLTVGPENTDDEVDHLLSVLPEVVAESRTKSRGGSPK
jgi:cysteine desulfurase